jgi:putrescine transport system substrate-binding protein
VRRGDARFALGNAAGRPALPGSAAQQHQPEDYKKAEALLLKLRPHIAYFNSSKFISDLSNGNICVAVGWSGAMLEAKTNAEQAGNGVKIAYSLPKEGAPVWFDTLVLLKDAPHPQQGLAFIDYLMCRSDCPGQ